MFRTSCLVDPPVIAEDDKSKKQTKTELQEFFEMGIIILYLLNNSINVLHNVLNIY